MYISKNHGQNTPLNAFLADKQLRAIGVEPTRANSQPIANKGLTENRIPVLSTSLDILLQKHPEIKQIISAWPELPDHIKQTIKALVQTHETEAK